MDLSRSKKFPGDILIVDDNLENLNVLSDMLMKQGYTVRGARSGFAALEIIKKDTPELVLLDIMMPDMDGYEVCRHLKRSDRYKHIPIIFLSALTESINKIMAFKVGGTDFITKPFHKEEVAARVDTHLSLSRLRQNLEQMVKKQTAELTDSLDRFRLFADNNPHLIYIKNAEKKHVYFNNAVEIFSKHHSNGLIGSKTRDFLPKELADTIEQYDQKVIDGDNVVYLPEYDVVINGTRKWYKETKFSIPGPGGHRYIGGIVLDITNEKESTEKLKKALNEINKLKDRLELENVYFKKEATSKYKNRKIVGSSESLKQMMDLAKQVAQTDSTCLILGETGTGKELLARAVHEMSPRKNKTMVRVNCAAIPATLIESEFFGREKGAYTGALTRNVGRFEMAKDSTILLDEIGELPLDIQVKLLRVLQEGQFERLGDNRTIETDVRVIASTNRDLNRMVEQGGFRKDLFYRLNVFPITVPPLRERISDIPQLVWSFVGHLGQKMGKSVKHIPRDTMMALQNYDWPGNIRELKNVIERAMIITSGSVLADIQLGSQQDETLKDMSFKSAQKAHLAKVLEMTGWQVKGRNGAAQILEMNPSTLNSKIKKLGIVRPDKNA